MKRGLYSNEAGVGSAPNASASAKVSHPAKQGLVQTLSVYIDTLLLCTATALMCLSSGVERSEAVSGAPYVQNALSSVIMRRKRKPVRILSFTEGRSDFRRMSWISGNSMYHAEIITEYIWQHHKNQGAVSLLW